MIRVRKAVWGGVNVLHLGAQSGPAPVAQDCGPPGSSVHKILRQEYWSGLPFPSPGDLPNTGTYNPVVD